MVPHLRRVRDRALRRQHRAALHVEGMFDQVARMKRFYGARRNLRVVEKLVHKGTN